ncbi:hypothetical protein [Streptomyces lunaelactis]|uniref:hypothetical protein n=1 Tax=Streptomyces lunaelactis TaxID=1535768 RepID=UPI001584ADF8|nr:hypothetical protein [Streptomyces lunaelactis]NUK21959.1 hypothetical protein [Streptomyces lunaelactis]
MGPHDEDRRREVARRLLYEDGPAVADRVAGLLLLLYAQTVNTVRHLTVGDVQRDDDQLKITFGDRPIVLPALLDALKEELITSRRGHTLLDVPGAWLFPGRLPGQLLRSDALVKRLRSLGIQPRQDRGTAVFTIAVEVPAAILAHTLGIHRSVAVQWQRASGGDWAAYAADVAAALYAPRRPSADQPPKQRLRQLPTPSRMAETWSQVIVFAVASAATSTTCTASIVSGAWLGRTRRRTRCA